MIRSAPDRLVAVVICLAAFLARLYQIDGQSLWSDEGATAYMTRRAIPEILDAAAADIHPPLYYLVAAGWAMLTGTSELALRYPALVAGVLVVALTYHLGRRCLGPVPALIGAVFAAGSVLLIYYSQEARMYQQLALLGLLTIALALRWTAGEGDGPPDAAEATNRRPLSPPSVGGGRGGAAATSPGVLSVAYVATLAALLYTQYLGVLPAIAANLIAIARIGRSGRRLAGWLALQIIAAAIFLPWAIRVLPQLGGWPAISEPLGAAEYARDVFRVFSYGLSWDATVTAPAEALVLGLLILGLIWPLVRPGGWRANSGGWTIVLTIALVPVIGLFLLSLRRPAYNPKFLLPAVPGFALWLALGAEVAGRVLGRAAGRVTGRRPATVVAAAGVMLGLMGLYGYFEARGLRAYFVEAKYQRDDYRGLAATIAAAERPGDAIILNAPGQAEIFSYYYRGAATIYPLPADRPPDRAATEAALARIAADHGRVWLVLWAVQQSDPDAIVENWLDRNAFKSRSEWYGSVRLVAYSLADQSEAGERSVGTRFDGGIELIGYRWAGSGGDPRAAGGEVVNLELVWRADRPIARRYVVFAHLIDPAENIWGQRDSEPGGGAYPTTAWPADTPIRDKIGLPIVFGTPPGDYPVEVGLYDPATGERLRTAAGDTRVLIGPVAVAPVDRPGLPPDRRRPGADRVAGPIRLIDLELHALGREPSARTVGRGELVRLATLWQRRPDLVPAGPVRLRTEFLDGGGRAVLTHERELTDGRFPVDRWRPDEAVLDQARIPADLPAGRYEVRLTRLDGDRARPVDAGRSVGAIEVRG